MSQEDLKKKFPKVYEFFGGDEYRASVLINKYLLRDREGNFLEHSVEEVIERVARNIAQHTEDPAAYFVRFRDAIDGFRGVCPQGSILAAAGNDIFLQSLSNCFVTSSPEDTMSSIFGKAAIEQVSVLKFRGGDGMCLDNLRPEGTSVSNAARTSSGVPGFSHQISNNCNTVAQCLDGESLVLTKAGLKKIKDIEIDEKVWTHNKWATVLNKVKNTKNVIKLHTEYGRELICSEDHVIGTPEGEIKAGSLKEGDSINAIVGQGWIGKPIELNYHYERQGNNQSNRLREIKVPRTLSPSFAYLIGNIYGDGCLEYVKGKKSMLSVALSPNHPEIKEKLVRIAETELGVYAKIGKGDGCEVLGLGSRALIALLEQNNLLKQKAHELVFPESLLTAQTEVVMAFISGFFDADGSAALKKKSYKLCSVCKPFLSKIQMVLQAHGIISKIHSTDRSNFGWRTLYSLTINGKRSQNLFKRYCHESIKISASHWHNKVRDFTRTPYRVKDFNTKSSRHSYIIDNKQYITYSTLERLCFDLSLSSDNYLLVQDRIKSISEYPQGDVYDLCLDHSHLFFCQGIQVHNSGRRGAQMITLSVKHPDAEGFAKMKLDPTRVTGANVSLKLTDEFMKAVEEDGVFVQQWPVDSENPEIVKKIKARDLWKVIVNSAWTRAEPGLLNWDRITRTLPAHFFPGFKTRSTNPCSEIPLSEYDACRLTTICLTKYVKNKFEESAYFDFDGFKTDVRTGMRFMDAVVDAEIAQIQKIIDKVKKDQVSGKFKDPAIFNIELEMWEKIKLAATNGRRCGLGTHGLGDCLAQLRIRYDSDEAIKMVDSIYRTLSHTAYDESIEMAIEKGPFPVWDWETEKECEFFKHFPEELLEKMKRHGRRNISILTIAPTGSIATLSGSSSGIEPSFRLCYLRRKKVNPNDINTRVDFVDLVGEKWQNYLMTDYNVKTYLNKFNIHVPSSVKSDAELLDYIPDYFITADKIDWRKRVKIQGTAQKYLDHSISATLNLPENVSEEVVGGIYMEAWKEGLKGVTVYREGCRSGVLISNDTKKEEEGRPTSIARQEAPKRSDRLPCDVHITKVKGEEWVVIIGLMNGTVYEVFCGEHKNHIPAKSFSGHVVKKGKKNYILEYIDDSGKVKELDINKYFKNEEYQGITRLLSMSIRHGTPLEYVIQQLQRSSLAVNGLEAALSRILKKYIKIEDLQKIHNKCGTCGSSDVTSKHESGCLSIICNSCNAVDSKCN